MNILHTYESSDVISLDGNATQIEKFNGVVRKLQRDAIRDMKGEGFPEEKLSFSLELEVISGGLSTVIDFPRLLLETQEQVKGLLGDFGSKTGAKASELTVRLFRLRAISPIMHPELPSHEMGGGDSGRAMKSQRDVYWKDGFIKTNIYERKLMGHGNVVRGPAVIESETTTICIPSGKKYAVDRFLVGVIEQI